MSKCSSHDKNSIFDSQICRCIDDLKMQRDELDSVIEKQKAEKTRLQTEIERLTYKIGLVNKSLQQRILTRANYEKTIIEAEKAYYRLVESSNILLTTVQREQGQLENVMNKNVNTSEVDLTCCESAVCPANKAMQLESCSNDVPANLGDAKEKCVVNNCPELKHTVESQAHVVSSQHGKNNPTRKKQQKNELM